MTRHLTLQLARSRRMLTAGGVYGAGRADAPLSPVYRGSTEQDGTLHLCTEPVTHPMCRPRPERCGRRPTGPAAVRSHLHSAVDTDRRRTLLASTRLLGKPLAAAGVHLGVCLDLYGSIESSLHLRLG